MTGLTKMHECTAACRCSIAADDAVTAWSRRRVLSMTIAGAAGMLTAAQSPARAQTSLSPDAALQELIDGNRRFTEGRLRSFDEDLQLLKEKTAEKQEPFAAVLSCADSRVPVELLFDQSIGHVFVTRVAGNVASAEVIASLEYGVAVLGTRVIVVLGHGNCGAVKAAIDAKPVPGQISVLYRYLRPAVKVAGADLDAAIKANAGIQAGVLRDASPVLAEAVQKNRLKIAAAFYDLASGKVSLVN